MNAAKSARWRPTSRMTAESGTVSHDAPVWIYYQPLWAVLSVGLAVLVIYALAAYRGHRFGERIERG
jgi:hypothetical protein